MRLQHPQGKAAEDAAARYLQQCGCRIVERNWNCRYGEIDLIVNDGGVCVFVEVRLRSSKAFGGAAASITPAKQRKISNSAEAYLQSIGNLDLPCRFDAVLLDGNGHLEWLKNILESS